MFVVLFCFVGGSGEEREGKGRGGWGIGARGGDTRQTRRAPKHPKAPAPPLHLHGRWLFVWTAPPPPPPTPPLFRVIDWLIPPSRVFYLGQDEAEEGEGVGRLPDVRQVPRHAQLRLLLLLLLWFVSWVGSLVVG